MWSRAATARVKRSSAPKDRTKQSDTSGFLLKSPLTPGTCMAVARKASRQMSANGRKTRSRETTAHNQRSMQRRGHVRRIAGASGRRNPAPMVGPRHRPHDACAVRIVLRRHAGGRQTGSAPATARRVERLVRQERGDLLRLHRGRSTSDLVDDVFGKLCFLRETRDIPAPSVFPVTQWASRRCIGPKSSFQRSFDYTSYSRVQHNWSVVNDSHTQFAPRRILNLSSVGVDGGCYVVACRRSCRAFLVPIRERAWAECPECGARTVLRPLPLERAP
jgi:hypothetical protein